MNTLTYVTIDRIFSKVSRDLKGTEINETDVIEWIGEALEFLEVPQILVEEVDFLSVVDNHVDMPLGLHMISQIARDNTVVSKKEDAVQPLSEVTDTKFLDLDWTYYAWTSSDVYKNNYTPVRLATGSFFNSLVCKEKDTSLYQTCDDEYTIVGETEKRIRFNFPKGDIAISYLKNSVDPKTGYPLIPDNISYITAITYYIKWKIAEMYDWAGREGWSTKSEKAEARWSKYARQAKNYMKMPKTLDQHQNLLEQSHNLIPNHNRYYGFFGDLGKRKTRNYETLNKRG